GRKRRNSRTTSSLATAPPALPPIPSLTAKMRPLSSIDFSPTRSTFSAHPFSEEKTESASWFPFLRLPSSEAPYHCNVRCASSPPSRCCGSSLTSASSKSITQKCPALSLYVILREN